MNQPDQDLHGPLRPGDLLGHTTKQPAQEVRVRPARWRLPKGDPFAFGVTMLKAMLGSLMPLAEYRLAVLTDWLPLWLPGPVHVRKTMLPRTRAIEVGWCCQQFKLIRQLWTKGIVLVGPDGVVRVHKLFDAGGAAAQPNDQVTFSYSYKLDGLLAPPSERPIYARTTQPDQLRRLLGWEPATAVAAVDGEGVLCAPLPDAADGEVAA